MVLVDLDSSIRGHSIRLSAHPRAAGSLATLASKQAIIWILVADPTTNSGCFQLSYELIISSFHFDLSVLRVASNELDRIQLVIP